MLKFKNLCLLLAVLVLLVVPRSVSADAVIGSVVIGPPPTLPVGVNGQPLVPFTPTLSVKLQVKCATVHTLAVEQVLAAHSQCGFHQLPGTSTIIQTDDSTGTVGDCGYFNLAMNNMGRGYIWWEVEITSWFFPIASTFYYGSWVKQFTPGAWGYVSDEQSTPWYNPFAMGYVWWSNKIIPAGMGWFRGQVDYASEWLMGGESCSAPPGLATQVYVTP